MKFKYVSEFDTFTKSIKFKKISRSIKGIQFGFFETDGGYGVFLSGSKCFDKSDDWACDEDYLHSVKYVFRDERKWSEIEKLLLEKITNFVKSNTSFKRFEGVAAGFVDGELFYIT